MSSTRSGLAALAALGLLIALPPDAKAANKVTVYVDGVESFTATDAAAIHAQLHEALAAAGYRALHPTPGTSPCPAGKSACLAARARDYGCALGLKATYVELAGERSIALHLVSARDGRAARHLLHRGDGEAFGSEITSALQAMSADLLQSGSSRPLAAWSLTGTSAALAAAGGFAVSWAYFQRRSFLSSHIDEDGDVVGISPHRAQRAERRARHWSAAGAALFTGAVVSGGAAGFLFYRGGDDRAAGIAVGGEF